MVRTQLINQYLFFDCFIYLFFLHNTNLIKRIIGNYNDLVVIIPKKQKKINTLSLFNLFYLIFKL